MADLFFKINADYEELIRMQQEAARLKDELSDFSGTKKEFTELSDRLADVQGKIYEISDNAAQEFKKAFSEMDSMNPEFIDSFTQEAEKFSENMGGYFTKIQSEYENMLQQLDGGAERLELVRVVDGGAAEQIHLTKEELDGMRAALIENIEQCKLQREVWDGMYDSTTPKDAEADVESVRAEMQEYLQTIQGGTEGAGDFVNSSQAITEALGEQSTALKALSLEQLKSDYKEAAQRLGELAQQMVNAQEDYTNAEAKLQNLKAEASKEDSTVTKTDLQEAVDKMQYQKKLLIDIATKYEEVNADVETFKKQLDEASGHQMRMRTQIMNAREEMMQLIAAGEVGTPAFQRLATEAGNMRRQMNLANATMSYFSTPQRHLAALKTGLQGVAGAAGLVTGVMGLFNTNSEKMAQIQTKVQSIMAVIVGLEATYGALKKTSTLMLAVEEVKTWAVALAKKGEAAATEEATVAQLGLNAAMDANPIGAIIVVVMAAAAAIYALVSGIKALIDANSESAQAAEFAKNEIARQKEVIEEMNKSISKSTGEQISKYNALKNEWVGLRSELEKKKFIKDHEKDFHDLGVSIDNVSDATNFFATKGTEAFNNACIARAKAMAYAAAATAEFQRAIEAQMNIETIQKVLDLSRSSTQLVANAQANGLDPDEFDAFWRTYEGKRDVLEKQQKAQQRIVDAANARGRKYIELGTKETKNYENFLSGAGIRRYEGGSRSTSREGRTGSSGGGGKTTETFEDKRAKEVEEEEKNRKREFDKRRKLDQEALKAEQSAAKKRAMQRKMDLQDTEEYYRSLELQRIADEKAKYDEDHKNDKNRTSYYDSAQYKNHFLDEKDEFNDKMNKLNLKAYENEMQFYANLREVQQKMSESEELQKTLQSVEAFFDERVRIEKKYIEQREKIRKAQEQGAIDEATANILTENVNKQQAAEEKKVGYDKFNNSPLLAAAMTSSQTTYDELSDYREQFDTMISDALQEATVADFKGILDSYTKLTDEMASKNPFGEMIASAQELQAAEQELETETGKLEDLYKDLGTNSKGEESGKMKAAHKEADDAADALQAATVMRELAEQNLSDANQNFIDAQADGATDEELASLVAAQEGASNALVKAIQNEDEARKSASVSSQKYADMLNQVSQQEDKVRKANMKVQTQQKRSDKATKASISTIKQWASAIKSAAGEFQSPVASAISGMMDLTATTLDSIEAMKQSGYGAAKGVEKVAKAVTNAVAILAIIQAAWQVINQIMSLFTGKDEEEYKKRVDGLKSEIDALDYSFNALKEDMDEAWGTEAIDAYIKAVETLNDRQKAQLELIKEQSKAHIGHHSLEYYQKKEANITNKELAEAKKRIAELGGDVSGEWITDWLYSMTAEQLAEFMKSGIGVTIMGKLGGVSGTGDYSGSDWREDMQAFADSAKTVEDLADEMAEKLNGISLDGLKDEFKELVTTFDTSLNDINNSFDNFMRESIYNSIRTKFDKELEGWFSELEELNKKRDEGMDETEYKKALDALREKYAKLAKNAQDDYQQQLTDAGVNVKDIEQGATTGGFEAMSEDTGTELNGRFAAMQAQETITAENTTQLLVLTGAVHDIADEIRDVQVNSYMELREINENTKKVVEPILTMQEDIKKIKENTESL